jgi:hypothetical protein
MYTFLLALALAQTPIPIAKPADSIGWDFTDEQLTSGLVTTFSVCLDSNPCVQITPADAKSPTVANLYRWKLPPLTIGTHLVTVQACNPDMCSGAAPLTFKLVITPDTPPNIRLVSGGDS